MVNVWDIAAFWSSFFRKKEQAPQPQKNPWFYKVIWVNTDEIDNKVKQDIDKTRQATRTRQDFKSNLQTVMNDNGVDFDTAYTETLKEYKRRWYIIEWLDIDQELWLSQTPKKEIEDIEEEPSSALWKAVEMIPWWVWSTLKWTKNVLWWAVAQTNEIIGNTLWFLADVVTPKKLEWLWEFLRQEWVTKKEDMQELLWVDPDSFTTKAWEFWAEIGTLFIPWWQAKLVAKFPNAAKSIQTLATWFNNLAQKSPKIYSALTSALAKSAAQWAVWAAKFDVVSQWEVSPTSVALGTVLNPAFDKLWKIAMWFAGKDVTSGMYKVIKPSTKLNNKVVKQDMDIIAWTLKANSKRPETIWQLYDDLTTIQKDLYTNQINPALQAAWKTDVKVGLSWLVDDIIWNVKENKTVKWKLLSDVFGRWKEAKQFAKTVEDIRKMWDLDLLQAETLKQYTSALAMSAKENKWMLNSLQEDFVQKLNKSLWDKIDDLVKEVDWVGVKQFKTEYGAISRHLDALNRRIIAENKLSGDTLFSGLWKIAWIRDIAQWNITQWLTQILTWNILKMLKDPDEILKNVMRELYRTETKKALPKQIAPVISSEAGRFLDELTR